MKKNVRCAVIGQHPLRFPWGFDEEDDGCRRMKLEMAQRIMELRQRGVMEFQVACDPGVGLYAAEIINILREKDKSLRLVCVIPHEEQATKWTPQLRERYFNMLAGCTELDCIDFHEQPDAQLLAYQRIIKQSGVELKTLYAEMDALETDEARLYKALDKLEAVIQHNESDIATWLPREYELNLTYADENVAFSDYLKRLREEVRRETRDKIAAAEHNRQ